MPIENENVELTIEDIKKCIPHRYPMLMIDKIENLQAGQSCVGVKNVTYNEPFFQGHFPTKSIMPGVFILEAMGQAAGVIVCKFLSVQRKSELVYFMSMDEVKFRKIVLPGDILKLHINKEKSRGMVWRFRGTAMVNETVVAEAVFTAMVVEENE